MPAGAGAGAGAEFGIVGKNLSAGATVGVTMAGAGVRASNAGGADWARSAGAAAQASAVSKKSEGRTRCEQGDATP